LTLHNNIFYDIVTPGSRRTRSFVSHSLRALSLVDAMLTEMIHLEMVHCDVTPSALRSQGQWLDRRRHLGGVLVSWGV